MYHTKIEYIHDICTIYARYMHDICTIYARYMHAICTLYARYMHAVDKPLAKMDNYYIC